MASDHRKNARGSHHTGAFIVPRPYSCGSHGFDPWRKRKQKQKNKCIFLFFSRLIYSRYTPQILSCQRRGDVENKRYFRTRPGAGARSSTCPSHPTGSEAAAVCIHVNDKARRVAPPQNNGNFIGFSERFSCSLIKLTSRLTGETETLLILLQYLCVFITAVPITKPPRPYAYLLALVNTRTYMPRTAQWHDLQSRSVPQSTSLLFALFEFE